MAVYRGWRFAALFGGLFGAVGLTLYPVVYKPMYDEDTKNYYKRSQEIARRGQVREEIQPGNMKVWTDPFNRRKE